VNKSPQYLDSVAGYEDLYVHKLGGKEVTNERTSLCGLRTTTVQYIQDAYASPLFWKD
jgi:hypothetical protein